jgi:hypothetical protein
LQEIDSHDFAFVSPATSQEFPITRGPNLGRPIKGTGGQELSIVMLVESKLSNQIGMSGNGRKLLAFSQIPNFNGTIISRGGQLKAIGIKFGAGDSFGMSQKMANGFERPQIPNLNDTTLIGSRTKGSIGMKANPVDLLPMSVLKQDFRACFDIP